MYEERILPQAEKALDATEEGHRAGKFSYLDVLDAQQTLEEVRRAHLAALEDLNMQAADLEGITGSPLGRTR
jgi:cobalt-zinc-cadmium efflux system outer membrane protein